MIQPGDIILARLPQADRSEKLRPALVLCELPGRFGDLLICGISSQVHQMVPHWDELLEPSEPDFANTGLRVASVIRLSFLAVAPLSQCAGGIGRIAPAQHSAVIQRLAAWIEQVQP